MKFIITESRLNNIILSYLDSIDWWEWDIGDGEFNLADGQYNTSKILYRIQFSSMHPHSEFEVIYLSDGLVTQLTKLFSIPNLDAIKAIINWFNTRYDKSLTMDNFEWMDDENQHQDED